MGFSNGLVAVVAVLGVGCGAIVVTDESDEEGLGPSDSPWSFELPSEGQPNDNGSIGPFCCTGRTATVATDDGRELGYAYFYDWYGQSYDTGEGSWAPDFTVRIAGVTDLEADADTGELETSEVAFTAGELEPGLSRSAEAGALLFTVTIQHADVEAWPDGPMFDMGTLAVRIDVDPVE